MAVLLCFIASQMLFAHLGASNPLSDTGSCVDGQRQCIKCPAGQFQSSCSQCSPCNNGTFNTGRNCEPSCFPCFRDCRAAFHMSEESSCSPVADVRCRCQPGYICTRNNSNTGDCRECKKKPEATPTPKVSATSPLPCYSPNCGSQSSEVVPGGSATHDSTHDNTRESNSVLVAILCPVVTVGIIALILVFCIRRQEEEDCFKQVLRLCNEGVRDGTANKTSSLQPKQPDGLLPHSLTAANLGPVHVHSAGTVIFSLLNQFTGQGEVAGEVGKEGQKERDEEEGRGFQNHPAPSVDIHLSQQERNEEMDSVFIPSQEQGKDCHISKEEVP